MKILADYSRSILQDFERYLRTGVLLVEDDFRLGLDDHNSIFITYELQPGVYSFKYHSNVLLNIFQPEYPESSNVIDIEFDGNIMKTKLIVRPSIITVMSDEISFLILS